MSRCRSFLLIAGCAVLAASCSSSSGKTAAVTAGAHATVGDCVSTKNIAGSGGTPYQHDPLTGGYLQPSMDWIGSMIACGASNSQQNDLWQVFVDAKNCSAVNADFSTAEYRWIGCK